MHKCPAVVVVIAARSGADVRRKVVMNDEGIALGSGHRTCV
jgi:hypothetical protein